MTGWKPRYVDWIWEPRDLWVGLYRTGGEWINQGGGRQIRRWRWYVILIPCVVLRVTWIEDADR